MKEGKKEREAHCFGAHARACGDTAPTTPSQFARYQSMSSPRKSGLLWNPRDVPASHDRAQGMVSQLERQRKTHNLFFDVNCFKSVIYKKLNVPDLLTEMLLLLLKLVGKDRRKGVGLPEEGGLGGALQNIQ